MKKTMSKDYKLYIASVSLPIEIKPRIYAVIADEIVKDGVIAINAGFLKSLMDEEGQDSQMGGKGSHSCRRLIRYHPPRTNKRKLTQASR